MVPPIDKVSSGISGLDEVLSGGLPRSRVTLVEGGPGSGKTVLGTEFIYAGARNGEPGVYVSFEEGAEAIRANAASLGWDLAELERQDQLAILDGRVAPDTVPAGEYELTGLLAILSGAAREIGARRVTIDAIDVLLYLFPTGHREEKTLYALHRWLLDHDLTAIITTKNQSMQADDSIHRFLEYMTDCVLRLDQRVTEQVSTRRLRVVKYRGSPHGRNEYPFIIGERGITLLPVTSMELKHAAPGRAISTGIIGLDALLDGGYRQGTAVMITGPSGVGKTTVAATFARAACENGERVLYVNLEQSRESLVSCMRSPGIDLRAPIDEGALQILTSMPESMGVEEHLLRFYAAAGSFAPQHVVLDTVSACRRMGSEQDAFDFVMRLSDHCKRNGITCIMTDQANGHRAAESLGGYSLSSAVDGVLEISFGQDYKATGELSIRKYRGVNHARSAVSFSITNTGVVVHEPAAQAREAG